MSRRFLAASIAVIMLAISVPCFAAVEDLPGMDTATNMKEWLKLTDEQTTKLQPVIETRITKVDAALAKVDAAEKPDAMEFIKEYGAIKKEFNTGVTNILTPDQLKQWDSFKAALETDIVQAGAKKQLGTMQSTLTLTDEQVTKLQPAMATSTQKKIDVLQKLADTGRISMRDKLQAKKAIEGINSELEKAMSAVMSPDQVKAYKASKEKKK